MIDAELKITLNLVGPVIAGATAAGAYGVDKPFLKNAEENWVLPGSHVRGRLREALTSLKDVLGLKSDPSNGKKDWVEDWLGKESPSKESPAGQGDEPFRGRLVFDDFASSAGNPEGRNYRIEMDTSRGAVRKGHHLVIEAPFAYGQPLCFKGSVRFLAQNQAQVGEVKEVLLKGLRWVSAFGGQRSVGYGQAEGVSINVESSIVPVPDGSAQGPDRLALTITPLGPFCLAKPRKANNYFESDWIIPGAAVKGSLASTLNQLLGRRPEAAIDETIGAPWAELARHFASIRVDHAFPAELGKPRPTRYPLSIVRRPKINDQDAKTYDVIHCEKPQLIDDRAPVFSIDWKGEDYGVVGDCFGWPEYPPKTDLRVRTAMDAEHRRVDEGKLFAYQAIRPEGLGWHGRIDLSGIEPDTDRPMVAAQLQTLLGMGLRNLGKTKVTARVDGQAANAPEPPDIGPGGRFIITLQTPALMIPPEADLNNALFEEEKRLNLYKAYWTSLDPRLELVRFFASQSLMGGYLGHRFQKNKAYNPFLLTMDGSVFALRTLEPAPYPETRKKLVEWMRRGLPLPDWTRQYADETGSVSWRTCPFVPENGFGEIAVNLSCHNDMNPPNCICEVIG